MSKHRKRRHDTQDYFFDHFLKSRRFFGGYSDGEKHYQCNANASFSGKSQSAKTKYTDRHSATHKRVTISIYPD